MTLVDERAHKSLSMCAFNGWESYRLSLPDEWRSLLQESINARSRVAPCYSGSDGIDEEDEDGGFVQATASPLIDFSSDGPATASTCCFPGLHGLVEESKVPVGFAGLNLWRLERAQAQCYFIPTTIIFNVGMLATKHISQEDNGDGGAD